MMPTDATEIPITEPPRKATFKALVRPLSLAAWHVRTFEVVAAFIPIQPGSIEQIEPARKAIAVGRQSVKQMAKKDITRKIAVILYSCFRKTTVPERIFSAIACIFLVPAGYPKREK
ncbi:hypothetical protein ES703_79720 [subsurface metagenome]